MNFQTLLFRFQLTISCYPLFSYDKLLGSQHYVGGECDQGVGYLVIILFRRTCDGHLINPFLHVQTWNLRTGIWQWPCSFRKVKSVR